VVVQACRAAGHEPHVVAASNDYSVILQLVARGLGVSLAPRIARPLAPPGVKLVRLRPPLYRRIHALTRAGAERRPVIAAFLEALVLAARPIASAA
jgi:DNA-binding transcriptional LysR family regulator